MATLVWQLAGGLSRSRNAGRHLDRYSDRVAAVTDGAGNGRFSFSWPADILKALEDGSIDAALVSEKSAVAAVKFIHRPENRSAAIHALATALKTTDGEAEQHYGELRGIPEYPKPSLETLKAMQMIMSYNELDVLKVKIKDILDDKFLIHLGGER